MQLSRKVGGGQSREGVGVSRRQKLPTWTAAMAMMDWAWIRMGWPR